MTYHVRLTLTAAVFVLFVYGEKLLLNHKMNKPLPWYVVLSLHSPSASKLSSKSYCPQCSLFGQFLSLVCCIGLYRPDGSGLFTKYATVILASDWLYFSRYGIKNISICQRGEYHSTRALIGSSDAGYPVLSTSGRSGVTARAHSSHF